MSDSAADHEARGAQESAEGASARIVELARPLLRELADAEGEAVELALWTGAATATAMRAEPGEQPQGDAAAAPSGAEPLDSAASIAILAHLREARDLERALATATEGERMRLPGLMDGVRSRGYATSDPSQPGPSAIAAPVLDGSGDVVGALAILAAVEPFDADRLDALASALTATADDLSMRLGFVGG